MQEVLFRGLDEETGTRNFRVIGELGTLEFEFPAAMKVKLGFERQVTHMFLLEFWVIGSSYNQKRRRLVKLRL
ncbi:hypothetical protein ACFVR1_17660 [Psychrobacillus sp. NPDC058041]|uniref:hypothetical protein n=1 Tax=Psychrobacillus sp. NPDC058041 TaxID=3346310 RepID=UPI0036DC0559